MFLPATFRTPRTASPTPPPAPLVALLLALVTWGVLELVLPEPVREAPDAGAVVEFGVPDDATHDDAAMADARPDSGPELWVGSAQSQIPPESKAPKAWQRRPCVKGEVQVNGMCFVRLFNAPDDRGKCVQGLRHEGMCLMPVAGKKPEGTTVQRDAGEE